MLRNCLFLILFLESIALCTQTIFYRGYSNSGWCRTCMKNAHKDNPKNCKYTEDLSTDVKKISKVKKAQVLTTT